MDKYFYGWYFKCQSDGQTLAIIPAVHGAGCERTCSIQFITENDSWTVDFPVSKFHQEKNVITIDKNSFGSKGVYMDVSTLELKVQGSLHFSNLSPIKYDIMGPFKFVPFMECRHSVYSMKHRVEGQLCINGKDYVFENALGYWEGDRGVSFPKEYAWTQCLLPEGSMMLSIADIPLAGFHFTGIIGVVRWKEKEYRFATYLGARVVQRTRERILVRQGNMELEVRLLEKEAHPLKAPSNGTMIRTIRENVRCKAFYRLRKNGQTIFALKMDKASFEYEYK